MDDATLIKLRAVRPDVLVDAYVKTRDDRKLIGRQYDHKTAMMELLQTVMLNKMHEIGVDQFSAMHHTVFKSTTVTATIDDRDAFMNFVRTTNRFELLETRAAKEAVLAYQQSVIDDRVANGMTIEEAVKAGNDLPPGSHLNKILKVNVRKGK